jgi:hypothetical protein
MFIVSMASDIQDIGRFFLSHVKNLSCSRCQSVRSPAGLYVPPGLLDGLTMTVKETVHK